MWALSGLTVSPVGCEPLGNVTVLEIALVDVVISVTVPVLPFAT